VTSLLPPNVSALETALEASAEARLDGVPVPVKDTWNPATCPDFLLPWIAWGLSIDLWDTAWSEAQKRAAIASAIADQRRKGTRASLRAVLDRFDPLIGLVEWFEDPDVLDPYTFRLELPLAADTEVPMNEATVAALLRDIAAVKPLRSHFGAVHRLAAQAHAYLLSPVRIAGFERLDAAGDTESALDPVWGTYLQTEDGEPLLGGAGEYLEES
jgi:phage tail P2-like protein